MVLQVHALLLIEEEERSALAKEVAARGAQLENMARKNGYLMDRVSCEEDAKRRTLLRYVCIWLVTSTCTHSYTCEYVERSLLSSVHHQSGSNTSNAAWSAIRWRQCASHAAVVHAASSSCYQACSMV